MGRRCRPGSVHLGVAVRAYLPSRARRGGRMAVHDRAKRRIRRRAPPPGPVAGRRARPHRPITHAGGRDGGKTGGVPAPRVHRTAASERTRDHRAGLPQGDVPERDRGRAPDAAGYCEDAKPRRADASRRDPGTGGALMNEPDLQALERRLHTLPPLLEVPTGLVAPSAQAAVAGLESQAPARRAPRRSRGWRRSWSMAGVAAVGVAAAVAVTITVT